MTPLRIPLAVAAVVAASLLTIAPLQAAAADAATGVVSTGQKADAKDRVRTTSLPAQGLFVGDQLSDGAKAKLSDLIREAGGMHVEVALLVPTGPWSIDGGTNADNDLTTARLNAMRRFLIDRGMPEKHVFVERRIDASVKEPRVDVQLFGHPADE